MSGSDDFGQLRVGLLVKLVLDGARSQSGAAVVVVPANKLAEYGDTDTATRHATAVAAQRVLMEGDDSGRLWSVGYNHHTGNFTARHD